MPDVRARGRTASYDGATEVSAMSDPMFGRRNRESRQPEGPTVVEVTRGA